MTAQGQLILIIEDDDAVRKSLERLLATAHHETESFASAEDFFRRAAAATPACIVMDIDLGDRSGLELARHPSVTRLRCPIILMSANESEARRDQARALGCAFLGKPFLADELFEAIGLALAGSSRSGGPPRGSSS